MKNKRYLFILINYSLMLSSMMFSSCQKMDPLDCLKSTGKDITIERSVSEFNKIVLNDNVNLVLSQGDDYSISISGGENLLDKIKTDISSQTLDISNENSCNWVRSFDREVTVYAQVKNLNGIDYRGSGDISCENQIRGDSLALNIWEGAGKVEMNVNMNRNYIYFHIGTADVYYSGYSHLSYISLSSFGPIYADEMKTVFSYIGNGGSNECYIYAVNTLEANITSIGNIYYKGNPSISLNDLGDGELINNN